MTNLVKVIVTIPDTHSDDMRQAIGDAGGGQIGNYTHCSFTIKGVGRFKPQAGAHPHIGSVGNLEEVAEERIEITCEKDKLDALIAVIRKNHPYEEPAIDIYPLL